ncbi:MAG: TonB-dependent receptor, partial [Paraglaciecola chathamensis]
TVVNALLGKRWGAYELKLEVLNVFDSDAHDIDYFYASRLPSEASQGVEDIHYHIIEPRTYRVTVGFRF